MSRKRRMFEIDVPLDDIPTGTVPKSVIAGRRGPMASAIGDTAEALQARASVEAEVRAENDSLAHEFVRLKGLGLIVDLVPLDAVQTTKLQRDRRVSSDLDLEDLKASLQDIGLSNPIRVEPVGQGGYELVQGLRRLTAYRELFAETSDPTWAHIPAGIVPAGESAASLYRRMVDENLVRKNVSFAEMAQLALGYAADAVDGCANMDEAVNTLYAAANPQKRSYIRRFAQLLRQLGTSLHRPEEIPRAVGLALMDRLEADPTCLAELKRRLSDVEQDGQLDAMRTFLAEQSEPLAPKTRGAPRKAKGRVALTVPISGGVRCTAADGKMELRATRDFSVVDRAQLQAAIEAFFAVLDEE